MLPIELPEVSDYSPVKLDPNDNTSDPVPPLAKATEWAAVELDLGDGVRTYRRELNVMPQWAGSCWYELRYLDPTNDEAFEQAERNEAVLGGCMQAEGDPDRQCLSCGHLWEIIRRGARNLP